MHLRATGAEFDVRKDSPYSIYDRIDFDVPVGTKGDNMDRFLVRMEEMEQSMRIVETALRDIPPGPEQEQMAREVARQAAKPRLLWAVGLALGAVGLGAYLQVLPGLKRR